MTQRERQTPEGGAQSLPRPIADRSATANGPPDWWEDVFPGIPAARQQELLALAGRQGLLYAHQLGPTLAAPAAPRRPALPALLGGQTADLDPLRPPPVECPDLDDAQRDAVARALHTPDVCLIQGHAGTGKSRVVAEIIERAAARGERVLLLAPGPAALDRVLERVGGREALCPVRCVAPDERPEALSACVRRLTFAERLRAFEEQTLGTARRSLQEARQQCESRRRDETAWPRLEDVLARLTRLDADAKALAARRDGTAAEVAAEADRPAPADAGAFHPALAAVAARLADDLARTDSRLAGVRAEAEKVHTEIRRLEDELAPLLPQAEAKRAGRWWSPGWWRATFASGVVGRVDEIQKQLHDLCPTEARLTKEADDLSAERARAEELAAAERAELIRTETARRVAEVDARAAELSAERQRAEAEWHAACRELTDPALAPTGPAGESLRTAREEWQRRLTQDEQRHEAAASWAGGLEQALATLPGRLARCANLVAATPRGLAGDPHFGEGAAAPVTFDLLILEEAEQVTEADFVQASRRARRCVLVGEPQPDEAEPRAGAGRVVRPNALRPGFFQRLWRSLRWDPRRLPYAWEQRGPRLHCRLRRIGPEHESWVQTERVADRPDVELRILARPRQEPELVEVVFPASTSVPEAKEYLFRELNEVTLQAAGPDWHWAETAERVVLRLGAVNPNAVLVPLCAGVRELVAPAAGDEHDESAEWRTCAVEFDRAEGWDRARAEGWAAEHLRLRDAGRTVRLTAAHRARPALAAWLSHLFFGEGTSATGAVTEPAFEFVAVPSLAASGDRSPPARGGYGRSRESGGNESGGAAVATRMRPARGGAGLEADLADARRIDQMPADLRAALPPHGVVNYLEAQALIRCLEGLLADPSFQAAAERWHQRQAPPCEQAGEVCAARKASLRSAHCPAVAVIALYPSQAELISRLLQRVPALLASPVTVEVGPPGAFRHRECLAALVSLTRSHTHRAVPYGDAPQSLSLALTRAADRLIVFGDPGTLARRSHWQGALDHLDEAAGERERALAARIVAAVHGTGAVPPGFRLREGTTV
jgi:hypothetical protein